MGCIQLRSGKYEVLRLISRPTKRKDHIPLIVSIPKHILARILNPCSSLQLYYCGPHEPQLQLEPVDSLTGSLWSRLGRPKFAWDGTNLATWNVPTHRVVPFLVAPARG